MSLILCDMDGVIVDWGEGYGRALDALGEPAADLARHEEQRSFNLHDGTTPEQSAIIHEVMRMLDYFDMRPISGAKEALLSMTDHGHDVMICTSPWPGNENCVADKLRWLDTHIGEGWSQRAVVTPDKTVIKGDWLIDDKPNIHGLKEVPDWTQIVFDQPYNREVTTQPRLMSWEEWDNARFS